MYLLDTNILLELLLEQENSDDVEYLFARIPAERLFITDFALYSMGIILFRRKRSDTFVQVVDDLFLEADVNLIQI
ncbi:MAG: VapC toxin family PIN domain ribonuclease, partial [Chloroflexi bacterium]